MSELNLKYLEDADWECACVCVCVCVCVCALNSLLHMVIEVNAASCDFS